MPSHGFARNSTWKFVGSRKAEEGTSLELTFHLNSSMLITDYQLKWPLSVDLTYTVTLSPNNLSAHIRVANTDVTPFEFQYLLHAYMSLPVSPFFFQWPKCLPNGRSRQDFDRTLPKLPSLAWKEAHIKTKRKHTKSSPRNPTL